MDPDHRAAIARGLKAATIDATVLRELLMEAHEEANAAYLAAAPPTYWVSMRMAILKLRDRTRLVKFHRADCRHFGVPADERLEILDPTQIEVRGYERCNYCSELSVTEWARRIGVDPSTVTSIIRKDKTRIRKREAIEIFRAIGEEPHPSLLAYERSA